MVVTIDLDINKAKIGLSLAYPGENIKHMTDEEIVKLFIQVNKKYGAIEKED